MKKNLVLLLALIMCLSLTACGDSNDPDIVTDDVGRDWRVQGIVRDGGTITRDGEDTYVLVCVHKNDAAFYYDSEDQTLFGYVDYPIPLGDNVWDMFKGIDFADINGDGNSDVTIKFDNDGTELLMVWFWDTQNSQFVYQPEESQLGEDEPDESSGNDVPGLSEDDYSVYEGFWLSEANDQYDSIEIDAEGDWQLYFNGDIIDEGYLWYKPEENITYVYSHRDSEASIGYANQDDGQLYISSLGSFQYHANTVSHFQGIWYLDGDLSAENYIIIDGYGYWEYYQRTSDNAEDTEIDSGTFVYSIDQAGVYYANSMYEDTSYLVLDFDEGILIWGDEGTYYRMEDLQ